MPDLLRSPWFLWLLGIVVVFPVLLVALTELHAGLVRRRSPMARPVGVLRTFALPAAAVWLLLTKASGLSGHTAGVRLVVTVLGVLVLMFALSGLNVALFASAEQGSWRARMPSIFVDLARLAIIGVGLAMLLSQVWGADVGAVFTALGVTSIVLGLALQNAVGSVISGLLLLFEQPFRLGDWLDTGSVTGRVVEVNWRAVHIDTGKGIQIVPNASLAGASFTNLSADTDAHTIDVATTFAAEDPPDRVCALLEDVAAQLPTLLPRCGPSGVVRRRRLLPHLAAVARTGRRRPGPSHLPAVGLVRRRALPSAAERRRGRVLDARAGRRGASRHRGDASAQGRGRPPPRGARSDRALRQRGGGPAPGAGP